MTVLTNITSGKISISEDLYVENMGFGIAKQLSL